MLAPQVELYPDDPLDTSILPVKTVDELFSEAGEAVPWVIENVLARGALTEFSGPAKRGGKTTYWLHGIAAGARGDDHAGFTTVGARYLYLTEQGNNFAGALQDSGLSEYPDFVRIVQFKDVSAVHWDALIHRAGAEAKRHNLDALIVDTFAVFARLKGTEENDSGSVADRMGVLRLVAQKYNLAVALIRHAGKDGTPRGSSAFEAEADICVTLSRPEGRHAPTVRRIAGIGRYGEWVRNIQLEGGRYISLGTDDKIEFNKAVGFVKSVLPDSPENGIKKQNVLDKRAGEEENISARTLDRALAWLVKQGDVGERQLMNQRGKPKVFGWHTSRQRPLPGFLPRLSTRTRGLARINVMGVARPQRLVFAKLSLILTTVASINQVTWMMTDERHPHTKARLLAEKTSVKRKASWSNFSLTPFPPL